MRSDSSCRYPSGSHEHGGGTEAFATAVRPVSWRPALACVAVLCLLACPTPAWARRDPIVVRRAAGALAPEGPVVTRVLFVGNEAFDDEALSRYMVTRESGFLHKTHYDRRTLRQDLANLERFYQSQGFLEADVRTGDMELSDDSARVEILIEIYEGTRWMVEELTFEGEKIASEDELRGLLSLTEGTPFVLGELDRDRRTISEQYARRSYLDARVTQDVTRDDERAAVAIDYTIVEREQARISSIDVTGDEKTRQYIVERELTFAPGELFDFEKIGESQANVYRTGLFNSVWIEPSRADTGKPEKQVIVRVNERPSGEFDFTANYEGINLTEGLQGYDYLELGAELRNRNLQGQATTMAVGGSYSGLERDIRASVGDPWFMGFPIAGELSAGYEWDDAGSFISETTGASFVLSKKIGLALVLEGGFEFSHGYVEGYDENGEENGDDKSSTETTTLLLASVYDTRNDVFSASQGMYARAAVDLARPRLGGTSDYTRYELDWRGYVRPRRGRVAALELRAGWIAPAAGESSVPVNERYHVGSEGLVRGFPRTSLGPQSDDGEPLGGMAFLLARGEARFPLYKKLRGAAFVDAGQIYGEKDNVDPSQLAVGGGLGVRFETAIGVLRLDAAWPLTEAGDPQYYLGIGQAF